MNPRLARLLTWLYPPSWRERYGEEFEAMLESGNGDWRTLRDSVWGALRENVVPTYRGGSMDQDLNTFGTLLRRPSAFLPVAMSLVALTTLLVALGIGLAHGGHIVRERDEGSVTHIWQLLMTAQMPIVLFFAIKWLRRAPGLSVRVLALQAGAWLASCAPVYFLHL
jgi:hypothetical protein